MGCNVESMGWSGSFDVRTRMLGARAGSAIVFGAPLRLHGLLVPVVHWRQALLGCHHGDQMVYIDSNALLMASVYLRAALES